MDRMAGLGKALRGRIETFRKDESGVMILLTLIFMILMLIAAGFALDFTRHEHLRYKLQATLDRCIIGAADIQNPADPQTYVVDCFQKAGMGAYIEPSDVVVTEVGDNGEDGRTVTATAGGIMPTFLLDVAGVEQLLVPAAGTATEGRVNVEIVMVLDVSGSMNSNNRLVNLRPAAQEFVRLVTRDGTTGEDVAISIVTYDHQVNVGNRIMSLLNTGLRPGNVSKCITFTESDYDTTAIDMTVPLRRADYMTIYRTASEFVAGTHTTEGVSGGTQYPNDGTYLCGQTNSNREILPFTSSRTALDARIAGLVIGKWTSIDIGAKWGAALLDPAFRPIMETIIANGTAPAGVTLTPGVPRNYSTNTRKFLIVMTDGNNTAEFIMRNGYYTGLSNIWVQRNNATSAIEKIWVRRDYPVAGTPSYCEMNWRGRNSSSCTNPTSGSETAVVVSAVPVTAPAGTTISQLSWEEVWAAWPVRFVAGRLMRPSGLPQAADWNNWTGVSHSSRTESTIAGWLLQWESNNFSSDEGSLASGGSSRDDEQKDPNLDAICDAAKANGVQVYTIAFEAPTEGKAALRNCATADVAPYYQEAVGSQITNAFQAIASQVVDLRLTQ
jgi:hypothetical protein